MSLRGWNGFTVIAVAATCIWSTPALAVGDAPKRALAEAFVVDPGRCLDSERLVPAVARWLNRDEIEARIEITVRGDDDAIVYGLYRDNVLVGRRRVTSLPAGCSEFTTALALSIAVAIEATFFAVEEPVETPDAAPPPPLSPARPPPPPPPKKRARDATVTGHRATLIGEVGALWNTLPGVRPLLSAGVDVAWFRYFETRASIMAATPAVSSLGLGEIETRLYAVRADACAAKPVEQVKFRACLGVASGLVESAGIGFVGRRSPSQPWLAMPLRGEARIAFGHAGANVGWGALATMELVVTLRRPQFGVVGPTTEPPAGQPRTAVLTLAPLGAAATAGVFFEF